MYVNQGRFYDFFQGVAEISSGGGENLPGGGEKIARYPPSTQRFLLSTHITNLRPLFYILDTCYKEIHEIYTFLLFLIRLLPLYASLIPRNVLGLVGVETPSNCQRVARGAAPPP